MPLTGADIDTAIFARLDGDATLTGLVQGLWNTQQPDSAVLGEGLKPYLTWQIVDARSDDALRENTMDVLFQVLYRDDRKNGLVPIRNVMARVRGDSVDQAGMVPSYGLHRHPLVVSGANEASVVWWERLSAQHDDKTLVYVEEYRVYLTEGTSP